MRKVLASLLAFVASIFSGGMVAQVLATSTGATEEYILVFVATAAVGLFVPILFFVAQLFARPRHAVDQVCFGLVSFLVLFLAGLLAWTFWNPSTQENLQGELNIITGLTLPNVVTVLVHWLIVRAMLPSERATFGRNGAPV